MKKTRCLITGSLGFIGSHLGDYLVSKGYDVVGLDNFSHPCEYKSFEHRTFPTFYADVRYQEDLEKYIKHSDLVYHLAAQINVDKSIEHPQETMDINLYGTQNVLDVCRRYKRKLVFACYDDKTNIYVDGKLIPITKAKIGDTVWSVNTKTGLFEKKKIINVFAYPYNGQMFTYEGKRLNFCITPNHKIFYKTKFGTIKFLCADMFINKKCEKKTILPNWKGFIS